MYRIGVDLGGTNIAVGVINEELKIVGRGKVKTKCPRPAEEIFDDIAVAIELAVKDAGISMDEVVSVGVGTPGSAVTLGTGVGSGIIIGGKIVNGVNYAAGEMGHMVIVVDGEQCTCGRRGCWEQYASATALISQTKDAMRHDHDSAMWQLVNDNIDNVNGRTAFDAMRLDDRTAKAVVDKYIYYVAAGVINIINALQPDIICIGGGISHEGETLLRPLRRHVNRERYSIYAARQTQIVAAELGNDAGIYGASLLNE